MNIQGILKSKIFFGIMCIITIYCIYEYTRNIDFQKTADKAKKLADELNTAGMLTAAEYKEIEEAYKKGNNDRDGAKKADLIVGGISGIFVIYYIFTNYIKKH
jgi:hypothetical protein